METKLIMIIKIVLIKFICFTGDGLSNTLCNTTYNIIL